MVWLLPKSTTIHSEASVLFFSAHQRVPVLPSTALAPTSPLCTEEVVVGLLSAMFVAPLQPLPGVFVAVGVGPVVGVRVGVELGPGVGVLVGGAGVCEGAAVAVRVGVLVGPGAPPLSWAPIS